MQLDIQGYLMSWNTVVQNTSLLFSTGLLSHLFHLLLEASLFSRTGWLFIGLVMHSILFLIGQLLEFCGNLSVFSSASLTFASYLITSLHGLHLIVGLIFLCFSSKSISYLVGFVNSSVSFSLFHWHFVDSVWIVLLTLIYELHWSYWLDLF